MATDHNVRIGGFTRVFTATPTLGTSTNYSSGDMMGSAELELTNAAVVDSTSIFATGVIQSITISDLAIQDIQLDIVFFDAEPTNTTFTDNAALDIDDLDLPKVIAVVSVTEYFDFADNSIAFRGSLGIPFDLGVGTSLWVVIVPRGTYNAASASDLQLSVGLFQD